MIKCFKCDSGSLKVERACRLKWRISCNKCDYKEILYTAQMRGLIESLTKKEYDKI